MAPGLGVFPVLGGGEGMGGGKTGENPVIITISTDRGLTLPSPPLAQGPASVSYPATSAGSPSRINNLALKDEVCCSLVVVRLRGSYLNNALKGGV
jgi:hypothetical protein